jgi:GH43 family beta-xylosidase
MECTISLKPRHTYSWWESIDKRTSTGIGPEQVEVSGNTITWHAEFDNQWEGMIRGYSGGTMVINSGGSIETRGRNITVTGADEILLLTWVDPERSGTGTGTGTGGNTAGEKGNDKRIEIINNGLKDYNGYLQEHVAIHGDLYNRVSLNLGGDRSLLDKPVEEIMSATTGKPDPALIELAFNAARYNNISATGINPPNLQGIWSGTLSPPWSGDYTTNGNLPVAVSAMLPTGTPELMLSTFDMLERHMDDFEENATELFGSRGIHVPSRLSSHGLNNHFDATWPMTFWTGGAGWYSMFYYDYFLHTCDTAFLTGRALPFMEKAVAFYEDFLVKGDDGKYIFIPSYSPENNPSNIPYQASVNATMDVMIAKQLLRNIIAASESVGLNTEKIPVWKQMLGDMPAYEINDRGELREWMWPGVEENHAHRHVSQLYALFDIMDPEFRGNHDLINGARRVITEKMDYRHNTNGGEMAFGLAQLGFAAAMIGDAETCYDILGWLTTRYWNNNMVTTHDPGSLFNLDLSGGYPALLAKMMVYSEPGLVSLLPAMPAQLSQGSVDGLLLRGGITIDHMEWDEGRVKAEITSVRDQQVTLQLPGDITRIRVRGAASKQGEIPSEQIITVKKGKITLDITWSEDSAQQFYYRNPNTQLPFRDTHIIPHDSVFYAIGTSPPYWGGPNAGVKLYRSADLKNWEYVDLLIDAAALDDDVWYKDRFWAPELHRFNNRFFLTFNCQNSGGGSYASENMKHFHACGMAVADNIEGPYTVVTHDKPLTSFPSNDMTLFQDEDGKIFCFFNNGWTDLHHIYVAELDTVNYQLKEEPVLLISQEPGRWDGAGIEGAHIIKNDGPYFMFYSSWTQGYAVGYATAESVYGPWTKYEGNPLFGAFMRNDSTFIFREGEAVYDPASPYTTVGHNQVFTGVDGRVWISCHGYRKGDENASMIMDPIWFEDGRLQTNAPTYTTQRVRVSDEMALKYPGLIR